MQVTKLVEFELRAAGMADAVRVCVSAAGERFFASVQVGSTTSGGLGGSAREALVAALMPFGNRATTAIMAAPAMFAASVELLAVQSAV